MAGGPRRSEPPRGPGGRIVSGHGISLLFVPVPEGKAVKNRVHLDLAPTTRTRDEEVARLLDLGAVLVDDQRRPEGKGWVVLADPEGNEFCVVRSTGERTVG